MNKIKRILMLKNTRVIFCLILIIIGLDIWKRWPLMYYNYMVTPKNVVSGDEIKSYNYITKELDQETVSSYVIDNIGLFSDIKSVVLQYYSINEKGQLYFIDNKVIINFDLKIRKFENAEEYYSIMDSEEWKTIFEKLYKDGMAPDINKMSVRWDPYSDYHTPQVSIYFYDDNVISRGISCELGIMDEVDENTNPNEVFDGWIPDTNWRIFDYITMP